MLSSIHAATRVLGYTAFLAGSLFSIGVHAAPGNGNGWGPGGSSGGDPGGSEPPPYLSFEADATSVGVGETVLLSWAATNVRKCSALGDWDGQQPLEGVFRTPPLDASKTYTMKCNAAGGSVEETISVAVTAPAPSQDTSSTTSTDNTPDTTTTDTTSPDTTTTDTTSSDTTTTDTTSSDTTTTDTTSSDTTTTDTAGTGTTTTDTTTEPAPAPAPDPVTLSLSASPREVDYGGSTTLSWSATGADSCSGWGQTLSTSGSHTTGSLTTSTDFSVSCSGAGGTDSQTVAVTVLPPPEPTLKLGSSSPTVKSGESVTLTWAAQNVSSCEATGAWAGIKAASGSELVGPLSANSTFTLACQSPAGEVVAMTSVLISEGGAKLSWEPPKENVDGSPLSDLIGYRVYVGLNSRSYNAPIELNDPDMSSYFVELLPGDYYISMTAVDAEGNESAFSNEVFKSVY